MSLRTKLAFFIPALRDLRASSRSSSSVNLTVKIAIVQLMLDVCHLYVKALARGPGGGGLWDRMIAGGTPPRATTVRKWKAGSCIHSNATIRASA